jgi:long-subunit acyl-CoA synthetase (AMP-forming)
VEKTIIDRLEKHARERGGRPALLEPRSKAFDAWDVLSWAEYARTVKRVARGFLALGLEPKDGVGIVGPNRPAWVLSDLAAIAAGALPAGIYATATSEQAEYILGHAGAAIAVCVDAVQAKKILALKPKLPKLRAIVLFPGALAETGDASVIAWEEMLKRGESVPESRLDEIHAAIKTDDPATLIYTSGTTGHPKAVMLSHHNLLWTADAAKVMGHLQAGDRVVSYLPLAHIAEQLATIHGPVSEGAVVHFVPVMEQLGDALAQVRPNLFFGVPRVWEKIEAKTEAKIAVAPPRKQKLFRRAQAVGLRVNRARFEGRRVPIADQIQYAIFDRLVCSKLRERLGLDQARMVLTGSAPLGPSTRDWMLSVGVPLAEVYGQSEDCGPTTANLFGSGRLGTVGRPLPGVEIKLAADGEILVRGQNVFLGYMKDEAATKEALIDGWLCSGDVGEVDADGYLKITDRKKDLIKTAGGKFISPQNVERLLVQIPLVSQAVVIGERRKYLSALLTLSPEHVTIFAKDNGIPADDPAKLAGEPRIRAEIEKAIDTVVNPKLARYETIKRFEILPSELSEGAGELTPTMKIKRKVVNTRYAAVIDRMYEGADAAAG